MNKQDLVNEINSKKSFLCIGLDTDLNKIPNHLSKDFDGLLAFNKEIIDATHDLCVSYKLNIAFYEQYGEMGWRLLNETLQYIPDNILVIADAKRGDIGNTSKMYARTFFETYDFHAITVAPYMGHDSVKPFLEFENRWVIILGLTSNSGSSDFQFTEDASGTPLYEKVLSTASTWGSDQDTMFVIGATHPEQFADIRRIIPNHFLLVPGVGAQGGDLEAICQHGLNEDCGLLVNSSRGIIYAGQGEDYAVKSRAAAQELQSQMEGILSVKSPSH